jgi:glycosyltransferase involved in cell wall biosynthesis
MTEGRSNIRFVGWLGREDIYTYLNMADLAVWPASQSIMWQAAIGSGLPLIVGNVGHQSISYLNLERNIIILERDEIRADRLAAAIAEATRPDRLREMREGALRVADEHLNWNRLIERTLRYNTTGTSARP